RAERPPVRATEHDRAHRPVVEDEGRAQPGQPWHGPAPGSIARLEPREPASRVRAEGVPDVDDAPVDDGGSRDRAAVEGEPVAQRPERLEATVVGLEAQAVAVHEEDLRVAR